MVEIKQGRLIKQSDGVGVFEAEFKEPVTLFARARFLENQEGVEGEVLQEGDKVQLGNPVITYNKDGVKYGHGYEVACNSTIALSRMVASKDKINYIISFVEIEVV